MERLAFKKLQKKEKRNRRGKENAVGLHCFRNGGLGFLLGVDNNVIFKWRNLRMAFSKVMSGFRCKIIPDQKFLENGILRQF